MKRSGFATKFPPREPKVWTAPELPGPRVPMPPQESLRIAPTVSVARKIITLPKTPERKSQAIRDSARGVECQVRIVGACNSNPETTVWSHLPSMDGGRGMGMKSIDEAGAYACSGCHDAIDGRRGAPMGASPTSMQLDWVPRPFPFVGHPEAERPAVTVQCVACSHWSPKTTPDSRLVALGFAVCKVNSLSRNHSFAATYPRECPKFDLTDAETIAARRAFIDKPRKARP